MANKEAPFSYAEHKWKWLGEETGQYFKTDELEDWYKKVNQSKVVRVRQVRDEVSKNPKTQGTVQKLFN